MSEISELIKYIREAKAVGIDENEIIRDLRNAGWQDNLINQAFLGQEPALVPIIKAINLTKKYGDFVAVNGISFEVNRGETFGILGPNGAGKTTTLEMMEGLRKISSGTVWVDGMDVARETQAVKSIIGVQLQASTFFESLTLKEILRLFGAIYKRTIDPIEMLAEVQLTEKANSQVKELSGGQKQRFSIAVGLVNNPKVLFLDEPTTGLDPQARRNLWDLVTHIKTRGTTIVLTTHYMEEAEILCDRVAIMDNANIIALDTPDGLLKSTEMESLENAFLKLTGHHLRE